MRGITYFTLFGLIAVTSLRIGEALNLENTNVDLENMTLILPSGKTGEERFVPFTESTKLELTEYISERDRLTKQENELFFRQANGSKYSECRKIQFRQDLQMCWAKNPTKICQAW